MTKADLVDKIHANTGLTKDEAFTYLETVLETIKKSLETAETVKISGFGSFDSPHRRSACSPSKVCYVIYRRGKTDCQKQAVINSIKLKNLKAEHIYANAATELLYTFCEDIILLN